LSAPLLTSLENRRIRDMVGDDDDDDTGTQSSPKKLINYLLAPLKLDAAALSQRPEDSCSFVETEDIFGPVSTILSLSLSLARSLAVLPLMALGFSWQIACAMTQQFQVFSPISASI
jgi:hypothetical protein